jgi:C-terminal processing protease CtpA/Prc
VRCDNRPFYHLGGAPIEDHNVGFNFFRGRVTESSVQEAIYGLVWDTLFGGGDPNGYVNGNLKDAFADFKANARGVVLDHRAGNGGTVDGAETATFLSMPPTQVMVFTGQIELGGWDGPESQAEGLALFDQFKNAAAMNAGSDSYDPDMPVALITHRDGSASDFFPFAFKGASDKVRVFGPAPTAGAFSTFKNLQYWGGISLQFATGDCYTASGDTLIGYGVEPDVVVVPKQSDLLAGLDSLHEAALAWLRTELKP